MSQHVNRIGALGEEDAGTGRGCREQRRRPRQDCPSNLCIHPVREGAIGEALPVRSADFSTLGLGIVRDHPMPKGSQFLVPLAKRSGPPLPLLYSVVHCRARPDGMFQIGAELVSVLDMDEFARRRGDGESIARYMSQALVGHGD